MTTVLTRVPTATTEQRRNLHPNPALSIDVSGFTATTGTVGRFSSGGVSGACGFIEFTGTAAAALNGTAVPATAGETVTQSVYVRTGTPPATGRPAQLRFTWSDGTSALGASVDLTGAYQRIELTAVVPAGVTTLRADIRFGGTGVVGTRAVWDQWLIESSDTVGEYFDGDTPNSGPAALVYVYAWTGEPGLSPSTYGTASSAARRTPHSARAPYTSSRALRTIPHQLLHSSAARFTYVPPARATGVLELLFTSAQSAREMVNWLVGNYTFYFYDDGLPQVAGQIILTSDGGAVECGQLTESGSIVGAGDPAAPSWYVRVPWTEVVA